MLAIEQERAKERQEELGRSQGQDPSGNVSERGEAREKAAEKMDADVSGRTRHTRGPGRVSVRARTGYSGYYSL
jgi:hypothetical protein